VFETRHDLFDMYFFVQRLKILASFSRIYI
jgi:hypothetical protein